MNIDIGYETQVALENIGLQSWECSDPEKIILRMAQIIKIMGVAIEELQNKD